MNKTQRLTTNEMLLCRDVLNVIMEDSNLLHFFRRCVNTNNRQLSKLSHKLDMLAKTQLNGGTPPSLKGMELDRFRCGWD